MFLVHEVLLKSGDKANEFDGSTARVYLMFSKRVYLWWCVQLFISTANSIHYSAYIKISSYQYSKCHYGD